MTATLEPLPVKTTVGNYFISNYPPFSTWSAAQIPRLLAVLECEPRPEPLGLYVHVPFCRQRCHYCYFRVYPRRRAEEVDAYVDAVLKEQTFYLDAPALRGRAFSSVYFGGGSPSYLEPDQLRRLLGGLREQSSWDAVEETTFECEPGTVTPEKLRALKELGVTRLSLGFQTLNDEILRRSGRDNTVEDCLRAFQQARAAGFTEINIDLLCGLAGETEQTWQRTIEQVLALAPECVTIYQLELTYNSALYAAIKAGREVSLPSWPAKRRWVGEAFATMERAGYTIGSGYMAIRDPAHWRFVYTVEHFWHGADLLALGETAFGHVQGVHYQNVDTYDRYVGRVQEGQRPLWRARLVSPEEKLRREVVLHLKTGALDAAYFRKKFGVELTEHFAEEISGLQRNDLIEVAGDALRLTRQGLLEVDWLLPNFYLPEHRGVRYT
jgi:oxygen-independent coproporphyrinogen-3 oxidase